MTTIFWPSYLITKLTLFVIELLIPFEHSINESRSTQAQSLEFKKIPNDNKLSLGWVVKYMILL